MIDGAFDRLAKWWRIAVDRLERQSQEKILGPKKTIVENSDGTTVQLSTRKVKNIMRRGVLTIEPEQRAADAAAIMAKKKIGALPVVHKNKLVGIITATDILKAFVKLRNDLDNIWNKKNPGPLKRTGV